MSSVHESWRREQTITASDWVHDLIKVRHLLSARDQSFADSLIAQAQERGSLSAKQMYWVGELTRRGQEPQHSASTRQAVQVPAPQAKPIAFSQLASLFLKGAHARTFVVFTTASGSIRLALTSGQTAYPGQINVTSEGRAWADRTWFGRIDPQGGWVSSRKVDAATLRQVEAVLAEADADPVAALTKAGAAWGQKTGRCCFCSLLLTDPRSVSVGYGPICAANFSLPWGDVPNKLTCEEVEAVRVQVVSDSDIPF